LITTNLRLSTCPGEVPATGGQLHVGGDRRFGDCQIMDGFRRVLGVSVDNPA